MAAATSSRARKSLGKNSCGNGVTERVRKPDSNVLRDIPGRLELVKYLASSGDLYGQNQLERQLRHWLPHSPPSLRDCSITIRVLRAPDSFCCGGDHRLTGPLPEPGFYCSLRPKPIHASGKDLDCLPIYRIKLSSWPHRGHDEPRPADAEAVLACQVSMHYFHGLLAHAQPSHQHLRRWRQSLLSANALCRTGMSSVEFTTYSRENGSRSV